VQRRTAQELSMAHIHLPDGVLAIQWILFWWLLAAALIYDNPHHRAPAGHHCAAAHYCGDGGSSIVFDLSGKRAVRRRRLG